MNKDISNRMKRIYQALGEAQKEIEVKETYQISTRNSPEDNQLRELLLDIHRDTRIAEFVHNRRVLGGLYDPDPNDETAWYLDWREKEGKVDFEYQQPTWGMGRGGVSVPFELIDDRFYARGKELLDLFPQLNADTLERCIQRTFQENRNFLIELAKKEKGIY